MLRTILVTLLGLGLLPLPGLGATIQPIVGLPSFYTPGQPVTFDVRLPDISNLGSYNIDLVLESTVGVAGVDYFFDVAATLPASTNYAFPSSTNYFDAVTVDSATRHRITLTDFDFSGVNVVAGTNDRVARVVFWTAATFGGPLSVFVDAPLLILDTPDVVPMSVQGFAEIQSDIAAAGPVHITLVPEPSTLFLGAMILVMFLLGATGRPLRC
jgi:hypothetical protein